MIKLSVNRDLTIYYVLSQCIVYWTQFQSIHTFIYQNMLLLTLFAFFDLKINESLHCILKNKYNFRSYQKTSHIDYHLSISIDQINIFSNILYMYHKMGVTWTYVWYISWSPNDLKHSNHSTPGTQNIWYCALTLLNTKHLIFDQSCF